MTGWQKPVNPLPAPLQPPCSPLTAPNRAKARATLPAKPEAFFHA
nr:MAG TPA: hypothetical protein [Bacteriophage sp.]